MICRAGERHDVVNADCMEFMRGMSDASVDAAITDPPYGATANRWDKSPIDCAEMIGELARVTKPGGVIIVFAQSLFLAKVMIAGERIFRDHLIWHKSQVTGHLNARRRPMRAHESIVIFCTRATIYNPIMTTGPRKVSSALSKRNSKKTTNYGEHGLTSYDSTSRFPTNVLSVPKDTQSIALHPTQKPVALMRWLIETYTNRGDLVFDPYAGAGTTGVAAKELGRSSLCVEIDSAYADIARARIADTMADDNG